MVLFIMIMIEMEHSVKWLAAQWVSICVSYLIMYKLCKSNDFQHYNKH